jgi:hypothetical protein
VAVIRAVGAAPAAGGGAARGGAIGFGFLQPAIATKATSKKAGTSIRFRIFKVVLPSRNLDLHLGDSVFSIIACLFYSLCSCNLNPTKLASKNLIRYHHRIASILRRFSSNLSRHSAA